MNISRQVDAGCLLGVQLKLLMSAYTFSMWLVFNGWAPNGSILSAECPQSKHFKRPRWKPQNFLWSNLRNPTTSFPMHSVGQANHQSYLRFGDSHRKYNRICGNLNEPQIWKKILEMKIIMNKKNFFLRF